MTFLINWAIAETYDLNTAAVMGWIFECCQQTVNEAGETSGRCCARARVCTNGSLCEANGGTQRYLKIAKRPFSLSRMKQARAAATKANKKRKTADVSSGRAKQESKRDAMNSAKRCVQR